MVIRSGNTPFCQHKNSGYQVWKHPFLLTQKQWPSGLETPLSQFLSTQKQSLQWAVIDKKTTIKTKTDYKSVINRNDLSALFIAYSTIYFYRTNGVTKNIYLKHSKTDFTSSTNYSDLITLLIYFCHLSLQRKAKKHTHTHTQKMHR